MQKPSFLSIFPNKKPIMGMLHMLGDQKKNSMKRAKLELKEYLKNGVDAVIIEDYFGSISDCEEFLAWMKKKQPKVIYGVNILRDYRKGFEFADKYGAKFVQIDSVCGHLPPGQDEEYGAELQQLREKYPNIYLIGGVRFKYQDVLSGRTTEEDLRIGMTRCDGIVVTGAATGEMTDMQKIDEFRNIIGDFPLIVGAGMKPSIVHPQLNLCDGGIVGSYFKVGHKDTGEVESKNVKEFMDAVRDLRIRVEKYTADTPEPM